MKIQKYRAGKKLKGKYWTMPDNWKGPFHKNDVVYFVKVNKKWILRATLHRNDGDGVVWVSNYKNDYVQEYRLPDWMQFALDNVSKTGQSQTMEDIKELIDDLKLS